MVSCLGPGAEWGRGRVFAESTTRDVHKFPSTAALSKWPSKSVRMHPEPTLSDPEDEPQSPRHLLPEWGDTRALAALATVAIAVAVFWWWSGRPAEELLVTPLASQSASSSPTAEPPAGAPNTNSSTQALSSTVGSSATPAPSGAQIVVDVRGGVRNRGIQQLPAGSRVIDAIEAAGGLRSGRSFGTLNLAAVLTDGEQVNVNKTGQVVAGASAGSSAGQTSVRPDTSGGSSSASPVNLNSASATDLQELPGVGPVLADRIVEWRLQNGNFQSVEGLIDVTGIGVKVLDGLRDSVHVG